MRKADSLRELLLALVPGLAADPGRLSVFVDKGRVAAQAGTSLSFEYRYTLSVTVQDYAGSDDALFVPVLGWVAQHQPELLRRGDGEPFSFEAELLDAESKDVSLAIDLSERVRVVARADGTYAVTHLGEAADPDSFGCGWSAVLREGYAGPELVAPCTS